MNFTYISFKAATRYVPDVRLQGQTYITIFIKFPKNQFARVTKNMFQEEDVQVVKNAALQFFMEKTNETKIQVE